MAFVGRTRTFINQKHFVYNMETVVKGLLSSDERVRLLKKIMNTAGMNLSVRELAREVKVSAGFVSRYMRKLEESGIIEEGEVSLVNPKVRALKVFLNISEIMAVDVVGAIRNRIKGVKGIGVYGSWANGTNLEGSDLDIWVLAGEVPASIDSANAAVEIEKKIGVETSLHLLTDFELDELRKSESPFYHSLFNSFVLWGEKVA